MLVEIPLYCGLRLAYRRTARSALPNVASRPSSATAFREPAPAEIAGIAVAVTVA